MRDKNYEAFGQEAKSTILGTIAKRVKIIAVFFITTVFLIYPLELADTNSYFYDTKKAQITFEIQGVPPEPKVPVKPVEPNQGGVDPDGEDPGKDDPGVKDPSGGDPSGGDPSGGDPSGGDPSGSDPNGSDLDEDHAGKGDSTE
ncbi:MAG: hypothetical protein GX248_02300 [Peptococcaceae bacterium]|jgi:hypothetical protein|nr:hypothetical protein [Peptococcaceae bacterium]